MILETDETNKAKIKGPLKLQNSIWQRHIKIQSMTRCKISKTIPLVFLWLYWDVHGSSQKDRWENGELSFTCGKSSARTSAQAPIKTSTDL